MLNTLEIYQVRITKANDISKIYTDLAYFVGGATVHDNVEGVWLNIADTPHFDSLTVQEFIYSDDKSVKVLEYLEELIRANFDVGQEAVLYKLNGKPQFRYVDDKAETDGQ